MGSSRYVNDNLSPIAIVDLSHFTSGSLEERAELAKAVNEACREYGFFQIVNHDVSSKLQDGIFAMAKQVFDLPMQKKQEIGVAHSAKSRGEKMKLRMLLKLLI